MSESSDWLSSENKGRERLYNINIIVDLRRSPKRDKKPARQVRTGQARPPRLKDIRDREDQTLLVKQEGHTEHLMEVSKATAKWQERQEKDLAESKEMEIYPPRGL